MPAKKRLPTLLPLSSYARFIITFHSHGDLDAAGSAIALARAIGKKAIIAPPDRLSSAAAKLLSYTKTPTVQFSSLSLAPKDFIIVLDSSSPVLLSHLAGIRIDLMIDHHARLGGELSAKKLVNDPSASSTCEMLHFLLPPPDKISRIALLLGIISDSAGFKSSTSRTFEAVASLLEGCPLSYSGIYSLAISPDAFGERLESIRSCKTVSAERIGGHIVATAMAKSHEAHFADLLISMGADLSFVACEGDEGRISARMRSSLRGMVHLGAIMHEAGPRPSRGVRRRRFRPAPRR